MPSDALFGETGAPVARVTAVVLEGQNPNVVRKDAIVNAVWKTRHEVTADVRLADAPSVGIVEDDTNTLIGSVEKLSAERGNSHFVKLRCLDKFRLRIRVVNQSYPMARRAACMT